MIAAHKPFPASEYHALSTTETSTDDGIDLIAVERIINGQSPLPPPGLTEAEQRLAVRLLHEAGVPANDIVQRTGVRLATVAKWVAKPKVKRELPGCPSRSAYRRHRAKGETCEPCKKANAEADRRYRFTGSTAA